MIARIVLVCLVLACLGLPSRRAVHAQGIPCSYSVTVLPEVDCGLFSGPGNPAAMNNLGHVLLTAACDKYDRTYLWTGGDTLIQLPLPPGALSFTATDLNDVGQVVGYGWQPPGGGMRGYIYDLNTGEWTELPPLNPPEGWSGANAITNDGRVCGFRSIGSKGDPVNPFQAFMWSVDAGFGDLGVMNGPNSSALDISEDGTVVGWTGANIATLETRGFVHADAMTTVFPPIPSGLTSIAIAAATGGRLAIQGRIQVNPHISRSFLYVGGVYHDLGTLPDFKSIDVTGMNNVGLLIGNLRQVGSFETAGFLFAANTLLNLNGLLAAGPRIEATSASAINERGQIIGSGQLGSDDVSFLLSPILTTGDVYPDCRVDIDDLLTVIRWWGPGPASGDANGDGVVNVLDLLIVLENWTF